MKESTEEFHPSEKVVLSDDVISDLYTYCLPRVEGMILKHGGNVQMAKDIFQEALIVILRTSSNEEFKLKCKLSTYVFAICRNMWNQHCRQHKNYIYIPLENVDLVNDPEPNNLLEDKLDLLVERHFKKLSKKCQKILQLHYNGNTISEIRKVMQFKSNEYVMDRKYRCKTSLINRIKNDPEFKKLKNESGTKSNQVHRRKVKQGGGR